MATQYGRVQAAIRETSRLIDQLVAAMRTLEDKKAKIDEKMSALIEEELDDPNITQLQHALAVSAFEQVRLKYLEMLEKGANLGQELGSTGHYVVL
jgi:predicted transcriptional regulator